MKKTLSQKIGSRLLNVGIAFILALSTSACSFKSAEQLYTEGSKLLSSGEPEKAWPLINKSCDKGSWRGCLAAYNFIKTFELENKFRLLAEKSCLGEESLDGKDYNPAKVPDGIEIEACEARSKMSFPSPSRKATTFAPLCTKKNDVNACMVSAAAYEEAALEINMKGPLKPASILFSMACKLGNKNGCVSAKRVNALWEK